jgi:hypothetical protein
MAASDFKILSTQSRSYIDQGGSVVNGYRVQYRIIAFDEVHYVDVPSLNPNVVKGAIEAVIADRKNLSTF